MSDKLTASEGHIPPGGEDGDNSSLGGSNEPVHEPQHGTGEDEIGRETDEANGPVNISAVVERFVEETRARLKADTQTQYASAFRRFARHASLDKISRRQLATAKGRKLLLEYLRSLPRISCRARIAHLKAVWVFGLNLPWPIDTKRDFGRLPKANRRTTPPDRTIAVWGEKISHEPDLRLRLQWTLIAQHGWRSSHLTHLRWRNVRFDDAGKPSSIVADGTQEGFKTSAPIAARLAPDVIEALDAWRKVGREPLPEWPIFPSGETPGPRMYNGRTGTLLIRRHFLRLEKRWKLPPLRPVDVRHWVAKACREAGLSKQASAYLMGHDPTQGGSMRDWYDNPQIEDILAEQAMKLPYGPLNALGGASVELTEGLPSDAVALMQDYMKGKIGTMEFATKAEAFRLRWASSQITGAEAWF